MELDFELDWAEQGVAPELLGLKRGDTVTAGQFLAWFMGKDENEAASAAMQLEREGISLSVKDFSPPRKVGAAGDRLALEEKLVSEGDLEGGLLDDDVLALTLAEYRRALPLSDEKVRELWLLSRAGDEKSVEALTGGCLGRVLDTAMGFVGKGVLLQDLFQEGCLALWQTITDGTAEDFLGEAMWRIRQAMARLVVFEALGDHIGQNLARDVESYRRRELELLQALGRTPTNEEVAQAMGLSPEQTETLAKMAEDASRMEKKLGPKAAEDPEAERPVEDTAYFAARSRVEELLSGLSGQDREILSLRFGLEGGKPMTPEETGARMGLTAGEILNREAEALAVLRKGH